MQLLFIVSLFDLIFILKPFQRFNVTNLFSWIIIILFLSFIHYDKLIFMTICVQDLRSSCLIQFFTFLIFWLCVVHSIDCYLSRSITFQGREFSFIFIRIVLINFKFYSSIIGFSFKVFLEEDSSQLTYILFDFYSFINSY